MNKSYRLYSSFLFAAVLTLLLLTAARAEENTATIKFSDPAKSGTVKIILAHGDLRVTAADTAEVAVKSEAKAITAQPRKDGLRVLTAASSFALSEKDNVVTLDAAADSWAGGDGDFSLTVPRNASVTVQNSWGGDIVCTGIGGDIEINSLNGEVRLDDIGGGVIVSTMNGEIHAGIREVHAGKPLSFTSTNGEVVLRVPAAAKANVRLRTQNGSVLTDFDDSVLVTKTETTAVTTSRGRRSSGSFFSKGSVIPPEAQEAIREAARMGVQIGQDVARAVQDGVDETAQARVEASAERARARTEAVRAKLEQQRALADAARAKADAARSSGSASPAAPADPVAATPPTPPAPPMPPAVPTITGGKLVTGTLNGGGPEISITTMNGDVTLRRSEAKK
jgi:hypothetical protein